MGGLQSKISQWRALPQTLAPLTAPIWDKTKKRAPLNKAPDVVALVLDYLSTKEKGRASKVCAQWRFQVYELVEEKFSDLSKMPRPLNIIGSEEWARCGLHGIPSITLGLIERLLVLHLLEELPVEGDAGGTLLMMPEGFDFNALTKLMDAFRKAHGEAGAAAKFDSIWPEVDRDLRKVPSAQGRIVFMTRNVLLESRNQNFKSQKALVEGHRCEMPDALTAATLAMVTYMVSQEFLFGQDDVRGTFTRTLDEVDVKGDRYKIVVGGFAPAGLYVLSNPLAHDSLGVGALRKF
jgi:hypothetical protein